MQSLEKPLTERELKKLHELMNSEQLLENMVERAVRGRRKAGRKARKPA
jgi:hypothetical protein